MNKYTIIVIAWIYLCCLTILSTEESRVLAKSPSKCEEWQSSVSDYNNKVDAILDGEPEDLMITLKEIIEAKQSGDTETMKKLEEVVRNKAAALLKINPPEGLKDFHEKLVNYHIAAEEAVDAALRKNISFHSTYTRTCYEMLLDYFEEVKSILIEKECDEGDINALRNTIIPGIKNILNTQLSEKAMQEARDYPEWAKLTDKERKIWEEYNNKMKATPWVSIHAHNANVDATKKKLASEYNLSVEEINTILDKGAFEEIWQEKEGDLGKD